MKFHFLDDSQGDETGGVINETGGVVKLCSTTRGHDMNPYHA
jgi:hypothetical protein